MIIFRHLVLKNLNGAGAACHPRKHGLIVNSIYKCHHTSALRNWCNDETLQRGRRLKRFELQQQLHWRSFISIIAKERMRYLPLLAIFFCSNALRTSTLWKVIWNSVTISNYEWIFANLVHRWSLKWNWWSLAWPFRHWHHLPIDLAVTSVPL